MTMNMNNRNNRAIIFKDQEHEVFYMNCLSKCKRQDVYHKPDQDITLYAKWENAAVGDSDGNTGDGTDSATKTGTSEATTGQDKKADTSAEKADGTQTDTAGAETQKEPVLQTGRTSPIYLLAAIGMFGVLLAALSIREGKRSSCHSICSGHICRKEET